ncbi:ABC transporter ATP-binding protein [Lachnospiraceae bacterium]|jgi:hypothetical protein|uniref:ABC transporter ATP-binding protein n=1 Tax=Schaedlerella arabinosiphila TaxID=2044587 RepID=A0A3R8M096_9FIRM|nr:ABC transporter ATP-binding protein [Schaedlerella arabinosiphila]NBI58024.1 ABC transporter ATP-binding protein [Lachnospiraceae bacterium]RRK33100.1 ABC transporter ATP-binding protein [Schaedlerella arabinosiphila]
MNCKPIVMERYYTIHTSFVVDFQFTNNITILIGNSGTGKTASYSFLLESRSEDDRIVCLNHTDIKSDIKSIIESLEGKLIVIDNADILLDHSTRRYITFDSRNQYLIIGRDVRDFLTTEENLFELEAVTRDERTTFYLKRFFGKEG